MDFTGYSYSKNKLRDLYKAIVLPRMIEEKMLINLRQGKITKWFSGIGQEAIAVGVTKALKDQEYIFPMHRNLGVFTSRDVSLETLFLQFQGKRGGFSDGRDRSFHFGTNEHHIVGMISHLGPQFALGSGVALANLLDKKKEVCVVFSGEGGTSEGDVHEAMNVASVWNLPVIFVIENNGYGLSTPVEEQYACESLSDRGVGYGMDAYQIDGNNILEVHNTIEEIRKDITRKPRPVLVECMTFRMRGHEEASGTKYVPKKLMDAWAKKDPVEKFEAFLLKKKYIDKAFIQKVRDEHSATIQQALDAAYGSAKIELNDSLTEIEEGQLFAENNSPSIEPKKATSEKRFIDAISDALRYSMEEHDNLVIMGQDVADYGGVFKITDGFMKAFGKARVRNTPICESAIVGIGLGLSIKGYKSIVEMQFADFVTCAFNQIVNNLCKIHYRWGQNADVVIRMPAGGSVSAGPFHSQSNESWFFHSPGMKIVYPSNPYDAKGLLISAINDPNPVMFFEHKALYRSLKDEIPDSAYTIPIGEAKVVKAGEDITIITYGLGVHWAIETLEKHPDINAELIDLRTISPLDKNCFIESVKKTGKAIVLHEASLSGGLGGEISAIINQHCFEYLDGPVVRCASLDTPIPFATALEQNYLPKDRFETALLELVAY